MSIWLRVTIGLVVLGALMVGLAQVTGRGDGVEAHPLGTVVVVDHQGTRLGVTVLAVRTGAPKENATPHYIDARFANNGTVAVPRTLSVGLADSRGDLVRDEIILFQDPRDDDCPEIRSGTLEPGSSYESCTLVWVPDGTDVAKVYFFSDRGRGREPEFVYWAAE